MPRQLSAALAKPAFVTGAAEVTSMRSNDLECAAATAALEQSLKEVPRASCTASRTGKLPVVPSHGVQLCFVLIEESLGFVESFIIDKSKMRVLPNPSAYLLRRSRFLNQLPGQRIANVSFPTPWPDADVLLIA